MVKKIIRGSMIGGFLGIVFGLALSYVIYFVRVINDRNNTHSEELAYADVFNVDDYALDDYYGNGGDILSGNASVQTSVSDEVNYNPPSCGNLEDTILRFHVRANSNSDEDIALKYMVRDVVLMEIGDKLSGDYTREEVLQYLEDNLPLVEKIAAAVIEEAGYSYPVQVYMANDYFPIRQYGEMVLPAGNYQALRIDIGAAEGENFWCILYPMMCYTVDSGAVVSKEDEEELKAVLDEEDYRKLFVEKDTKEDKVKVRFKLLEWLGIN